MRLGVGNQVLHALHLGQPADGAVLQSRRGEGEGGKCGEEQQQLTQRLSEQNIFLRYLGGKKKGRQSLRTQRSCDMITPLRQQSGLRSRSPADKMNTLCTHGVAQGSQLLNPPSPHTL